LMTTGKNLLFLEDIRNYGELQPLEGAFDENGEQYMLHPYAASKGGINMRDEDGVIPAAMKDLANKVAN